MLLRFAALFIIIDLRRSFLQKRRRRNVNNGKKLDGGYKSKFKNKEQFIHFLQKYIGEEWTREIRPEHIRLSDQEFVLANFGKKYLDVVWEIRLSGRDIYVFIIVEQQTKTDFTMPLRTLTYSTGVFLNIYENTDEKERTSKDFRMPAVVSIVFHNGENRWTAPTRFRDYQEGYEVFGDHAIDFEYYLVDLSQLTQEYILSTNELIDNIFAVDQVREREEMLEVLETVGKRVEKLDKEEQEEFIRWLEEIIIRTFPDEEAVEELGKHLRERQVDSMSYAIERVLKREVEAGKEEARKEARKEALQEGLEQGLERGLEQGLERGEVRKETEIILKMLDNNVEAVVIANFLGISKNKIEQIEKIYLEEKKQDGGMVIEKIVDRYLEGHTEFSSM